MELQVERGLVRGERAEVQGGGGCLDLAASRGVALVSSIRLANSKKPMSVSSMTRVLILGREHPWLGWRAQTPISAALKAEEVHPDDTL